MIIEEGFSLKGEYKRYLRREVRKICKAIPQDRRTELRKEITARANFYKADPIVLSEALKALG